ncbi:MAG: hypothetical protein V4629_04765 [Pseudomonadota bacterium]
MRGRGAGAGQGRLAILRLIEADASYNLGVSRKVAFEVELVKVPEEFTKEILFNRLGLLLFELASTIVIIATALRFNFIQPQLLLQNKALQLAKYNPLKLVRK